MGPAFLIPAFLAGLAALVVPVVLHLRDRADDRPIRFPSLMFLERLAIRTARWQRITDWPLLALRAGALALLALAFARPFFRQESLAESAAAARAVVVLLDRSLSMGHRDVWPAALDSVRRIVGTLRAGDRVAVVAFDEEAEVLQPLTADPAAALAAVTGARPAPRGTRYAAGLRAARQVLLAAGEPRGDAVVVTDLQRSGVAGLAGLELPAALTVRAAPVGTRDRANTTVAQVTAERRHAAPPRLVVQATVVARELGGPRRARLSMTLNGRASGTRDVTLPASGHLAVAFDPVPLPAGRIQGVVALEPDALPGDDTSYFALPAEDALRAVLVTPADRRRDETLFFERALAIGRAPAIRVERRAANLGGPPPEGVQLVVLWDVAPPAGATADALAGWVRGGGGLMVVAGPRLAARPAPDAAPPAPLPLAAAAIRGLADRSADRGGMLGEVGFEHPLFAPFRGAQAALGAARFLRYPRLEPLLGSEVLARFDDGLPALLERREGVGRVVVVAMPLDAQAGDFPLQPAYLPLLRRLVLYASGHAAAPLSRATGESWLLPREVPTPVITTPGGRIVRPPVDPQGAAVALTEAGFYATYAGRVAGDPVAVTAVNPPPGESDLTAVDPRELLVGVRQSEDPLAASAGPPTSVETEGRQGLWRFALALVSVLLMVETIVANRGWRAGAPRSAA
jgi:aerotolerance regulator-like protein/VWA domain-containing protein